MHVNGLVGKFQAGAENSKIDQVLAKEWSVLEN